MTRVYGRNLELAETLSWIKHGRYTTTWTSTRWYVTEEGVKAYKSILKLKSKNKIGKCPKMKYDDLTDGDYNDELNRMSIYKLLVKGYDSSKDEVGWIMTHDLEQVLEVMADVFRGKVKYEEHVWRHGPKQKIAGGILRLFRL